MERIDCAAPGEEALVIALLLRQALEQEGKTAALVTPDRNLARRVSAELKRWKIEVDDSAGLPLAKTAPGSFLRLLAEAFAEELAPVSLLALLKHPLAAGGHSPGVFRRTVRQLEIKVLRGPRPAPGLDGLLDLLSDSDPDLSEWLEDLGNRLERLLVLALDEEFQFQELLDSYLQVAENLAGE